ncbi:hypothetical protein OS493_000766 [Desmophyllum pertusum]|uniref:Myb/SANT-like DNA-binding domain-containing protein n=1 Tax=Desmophyllum pertusum TaxID=174260 RepID=A0A9X0ABF9_9CNID|nr:hypothetical protein OS493_000766 [Desmophyllum pertusum]
MERGGDNIDENVDHPYLAMLENPYRNYYGSQVFWPPVSLPSTSGFAQIHPHSYYPGPNTATAMVRSESAANQDVHSSSSSVGESGKTNQKGKKAAKYEAFKAGEEGYLVNLWVSYHEGLESKDSRKYWSKIADELNTKFDYNSTVEKCKRKMKYLVDRYKERKDWNRKQSGGSLWKSPHYDEIDAVLGVRDVVTFDNVAEAGSETRTSRSSPGTSQDSPEIECSTPESTSSPDTVSNSSASTEKESRRLRKKRKSSPETPVDPEDVVDTGKVLKTVTEQGDRITGVMERMQEAQTNGHDDTIYGWHA